MTYPFREAELASALGPSITAFDESMREPLADVLMTVYLQSRVWAAEQLSQSEVTTNGRVAASNDPHADAMRWAMERASTLSGYVTEDMHAAIEVIAAALETGQITVEWANALVAQGAFVGLTRRQSQSVLTEFVTLAAAGVTVAVIAQVVRYAATQRAVRGLMVGRTETVTAANAGQQALWMRAIRSRWVPTTAQRRWVAAPGACPRCASIAGQTVGMTESFRGPDGPIMHPPAHPSCRCGVVLIR
jgi:hypothetical protein